MVNPEEIVMAMNRAYSGVFSEGFRNNILSSAYLVCCGEHKFSYQTISRYGGRAYAITRYAA
ncbi:hypothetical protein AA18889_2215 [Acetobacter senegalensis DSM 18889]|nr:hypothetical protein AA18889_2215 [Acetobacter senegalensis DSM 18889]